MNAKITRNQQTLSNPAEFSGIGIHTGEVVNMRFCPAPPNHGIIFKRVDLPEKPLVPANLNYLVASARNTSIGTGSVVIHTIEHVLAALKAAKIDNLLIELSSIEPPVGNGSSDVFVEMIDQAGTESQDAEIGVIKLTKPVYWSEKNIHLVAIPDDVFRVSYTLSYDHSPILKSQFYTSAVDYSTFKKEIAPCRTFSLYKEIEALIDNGLIKGGSLDNAVVIHDEAIFSKGGLFFPNEMARHKVLDLIGDLSLLGYDLVAHVIAICSGHYSNCAFAKKILDEIKMEK